MIPPPATNNPRPARWVNLSRPITEDELFLGYGVPREKWPVKLSRAGGRRELTEDELFRSVPAELVPAKPPSDYFNPPKRGV